MKRGIWYARMPGNVSDLMVTGICILAMAVVMMSFLENVKLIQQKAEVSQLARQFILRMETTGCLQGKDRTVLERELADMGVTDIDLSGTTMAEAGYGEPIALNIRGTLGGRYGFTEKRVSTAKY